MDFETRYPRFINKKQGKEGSNDLGVCGGVTLETAFSTNQARALTVQEDFISVCQKITVTGYFVFSFH